jgi:hypothetical protein
MAVVGERSMVERQVGRDAMAAFVWVAVLVVSILIFDEPGLIETLTVCLMVPPLAFMLGLTERPMPLTLRPYLRNRREVMLWHPLVSVICAPAWGLVGWLIFGSSPSRWLGLFGFVFFGVWLRLRRNR